MDRCSPYLHHSRYVHRPTPPPPPSHPVQQHLPTNPNFHHSNLLNLPQLRPPPPPAPTQSHHLVSTPHQSFNLQNSQFTYNPNPNHQLPIHHNDPYRPRSHPELPNFSEFSRVLHRPAPFNDDVPRGLPDFDRYTRVLTDNWPVSPVAKIRHELETGSRFIEEHKPREELVLVGRADESRHHHHHRHSVQFGSSSDRSSRDFRVVCNQSNHPSVSRGFESNTGNYDNRRGAFEYDHDGGVSENQRWVNDREREVMRDALIQIRSHGIGDGDGNGIRIVTGKREHHRSREMNAECERHSSRGSREGSHEFNRTPRKQIQKKSALLRIQKPNYRKREDERVHYSGYFDDTKPSPFRGKDQDLHSDCGVGEELREGSPVELDVSFKSNSLVAKAIVTPPPGSAAASDTNLTPGNSKIRKVLVPDKDASNSLMTKATEAKKLENPVRIEAIASSNDMDPKQSKGTFSASGTGGVYASSSLTGSNRSNALLEKSRVGGSTKGTVSVKGGTNPVSSKTSSIKVAKRKKIVKKVVKKFVNPNLNSSQPVKTHNKPLKADGSVRNPAASSEPDKAAAMVYSVDQQPSPNEVSIIPNNDKAERLAKAMASEKVVTSADSGESGKSNIKRKMNCSMSPLSSPSHDESKFFGGLVNGSSVNLHDISDTDKDFTKSLNETMDSYIDSQNGDSFLLKNNSLSPKVLLSVENNADLGLLGSEKIICHEGAITSCVSTMAFDSDLIHSQEGIAVSDFGTLNVECKRKQSCPNQRSPPVENGLSCACVPVISSSMPCLLNSGKTRIQDVATFADCSNNGVGTILGSDNGFSNSEEIKISSLGTGNDIFKQPSPDGVTTSPENVLIGRSLNTMVSTGGSDDNAFNIGKNGKKVEMPQLDLSMSEVSNMCLEPVKKVSSARWVDTTLRLSFKDPSPAEFTDPRDGCMDDCFQPCNGVDVSQQSSSTDVSEAKVSVSGSVNVNPNLPGNGKKRKFSDFQLELCGPITNDNDGLVVTGNSTSDGDVHSNSGGGLTQPEEEVAISYLDPLSIDVPFNSGSGLKQPEEEIAVSCVDSLSMDVPFNSGNGLTQSEEEVVASCTDTLCTFDLPPLQKGIAASFENCSAGEYFNSEVLTSVHSQPIIEDLAFPKAQSPCLSELEREQIVNATPIMAGSSCQSDSMDIDTGEGEKMDVSAAKDQVIIDSGNAQCQIASELVSPDERLPCTDVESDRNHGVKDEFPSTSKNLASVGDDNGVLTINSCDKLMEFAPDTLANVDSPEMLPAVLGTSTNKISIEKVYWEDDKIPVEEPAIQADSYLSTHASHSQNVRFVSNTDHLVEGNHSLTRKEGPLPSQDSSDTIQPLNLINGESYGRKNQPSPAVSRICQGRLSFVFTASKSTASSTPMRKLRTWHRSDSSSVATPPRNKDFSSTIPAQRQWPKKVTKFQGNSYIRKGNSLVRKPTPVTAQSQGSLIRLNHLAGDEAKKNVGSDNRADRIDPPNFVTMGGMHASFERPRTPPLPVVSKMPNHSTSSLQDCLSSPLAEPLHNDSNETAPDPMQCTEANDVPKSSEDVLKISETPITQTSQINNLECQHELKDGSMVSSNVKSIYVKRKSNQLVASSNACAPFVYTTQDTLSSDGYYKRRKNQLIRSSLQSQVKHTVSMSDASLNSEGQTALNVISGRSFSKKRLRKVVTKTCKPSKFSLVWTLRGAQLANSNGDSVHSQKVLPHLFPWKKATYWRSVMPNSAFNSNNSSLSTIRKLLLLRKRDAVYTRSKHGFSLKKSKVLSDGGSSLKWSKSIERHSKKANEEATLAVAAAERKKREQRGAACVVSRTKSRNSSSRERIFHIGSVRYKMDSSGRTLQRISDDESTCSVVQTEKDAKRSYVPRRLVIGKDEYVQIGNGNQLIRDPKKRARILASEKVRWSLHTARSRLARRRKYCQFFTRFGKCNKEDGKCPYIHDSSKIAVCTKFLNGLCSNPDCKLTHKVIPERMPDCSYFLQGLCTNKSCPYRHVHVNPNAATCEGFLRGYCADGIECQKKHSYVCPNYEATGSCPQGCGCKLHHPKNQSKGKKSKRLREEKNSQGRYFGSMHAIVSEPRTAVSEKHPALDNGICFEGSFADYISLGISDEEVVDNNPTNEQETISDGGPLDLQFGDLDELIKPVRLMNIL